MMVILRSGFCCHVTWEMIAALFSSQLKAGMEIIMEYTQQIKLLCVARVSDLYMKVNQLGITAFILDIYSRQTEQMSVNTVHWESAWAILLHCHASV